MVASFGSGNIKSEEILYLISGIAVCLMVFFIGINCIVSSNKDETVFRYIIMR